MSKKLNETPAYELAGLTMDLMSKVRKDVISTFELKRFLAMKSSERRKIFGTLVAEENPKIKLVNSSVVVSGFVGEFNLQQYFTENKKVKYLLSDNFQKHVLNPAKRVNYFSEESFSEHILVEPVYDEEIMEHFQISESNGLMTREEILWTIASLTGKQPNGEAGVLLNNGYYTVIGYMLCDDGVVRTAGVVWDFSPDGWQWHCHCDYFGDWISGIAFFSRN